jgi:hypothetical protein
MSTEIPEPASQAPAVDPAAVGGPVAGHAAVDLPAELPGDLSGDIAGDVSGDVSGRLSAVPWRADLRALVVTAVVSIVMCLPVAALWVWLAPPVQGTLSQGEVYYTSPEGKTFIGQDGTLGVICCVVGLLLGAVAFAVYRKGGGLGAAIGLAGGGIAGGYLATKAGTEFGPGHGSPVVAMIAKMADDTTFDLPMQLRAVGMLWFWPLLAVALYFILTMLFGPVDPDPAAEQAAWGQAWAQQQAQGQAEPEQFQTGQTTSDLQVAAPQTNACPAAQAESGADSALGPDEVDRGQ